jgi:thiol-disulfide isomerase/thioredoxin
MKTSRDIVVLMLAFAAATACAADGTEAAAEPAPKTVGSAYRGLASSSLTQAVLANLPDGVLLRSGNVKVTREQLDELIVKAPEVMRDQLRRSAFFILEQMATAKLLLAEARDALEEAGKDPAGRADAELINEYLQSVVSDMEVADAEVRSFYEENKEMVGSAPFDQIKDQIRQYLSGQKKQEAVVEYIATLGARVKIEVAAGWAEQQAALAADNPVDKARSSGKPTIVDFGADGCTPCDMMTPILAALKTKYEGKLNVEFVHVREEQILAARYGVRTIPVQVFYDAQGNEVFRHTGFLPQEEIEKRLAGMGVE